LSGHAEETDNGAMKPLLMMEWKLEEEADDAAECTKTDKLMLVVRMSN